MLLIVSMGVPVKKPDLKQEGKNFNKAVIQIIDWDKKTIVDEISYKSPPENLGPGLSMQFKGASIFKGKYFVVTNTEILRYQLSNWELETVISHPTFNDLHGVLPFKNLLYVCNTGLEIVQAVSDNSEIKQEINLATVPTYERFNKNQDYRLIATTKPHEIHVNHLFVIDGELWATRGHKSDCINVYDDSQRISLRCSSGNRENVLCHDGLVRDSLIYFTSVNGYILVVDKIKRTIVKEININRIKNLDKRLGWVRGLEIVDNYAFIATSKLRSTSFKAYTRWVLTGNEPSMKSSIIQIDLNKNKIVYRYEMDKYHSHAIYSILKHPD